MPYISSGLKVSSTQGALLRSKVAPTSAHFLWCQNVKFLPIIASSQGGADNHDRQQHEAFEHWGAELETADR